MFALAFASNQQGAPTLCWMRISLPFFLSASFSSLKHAVGCLIYHLTLEDSEHFSQITEACLKILMGSWSLFPSQTTWPTWHQSLPVDLFTWSFVLDCENLLWGTVDTKNHAAFTQLQADEQFNNDKYFNQMAIFDCCIRGIMIDQLIVFHQWSEINWALLSLVNIRLISVLSVWSGGLRESVNGVVAPGPCCHQAPCLFLLAGALPNQTCLCRQGCY